MKFITYITILLVFASCEKQTEWDLEAKQNNFIIVDGTITDEQKAHEINLSFPVESLNALSKPVSGAIVIISNEDSVFSLTEIPAGSGKYFTKNTFVALLNKNYTLQIYYNSEVYSAKASMLPGRSFSPLTYSKNSDDNLYHIDWVANAYDAENYALYEVLLDWSQLPGYQNISPDSCKKRLYYYSLPTLDVSEVLAPGRQKIYFPAGTIITERRYTLTLEHAEFFRSLLLETTWQGGLFDSEHANLSTNLSEGALGFFGVCSVTTLSLTVE